MGFTGGLFLTLTFPVSLPLYFLFWGNLIPSFWSDPKNCPPSFFFNVNLNPELLQKLREEWHSKLQKLKNLRVKAALKDNEEAVEEVAIVEAEVEGVENRKDRVLVVGAGFSGLTMMGALTRHGIEYDGVEGNDKIGGNWYNGVYETVHIISSRTTTENKDFPMPKDYPDYPSAPQMWNYLDSYADHYQMKPKIEFNTKVLQATPIIPAGLPSTSSAITWRVELLLSNGKTVKRDYHALIVCSGHHWDKRQPTYPGESQFQGEIIHSKDYKRPQQLVGKRVLVVGGGNSACDIAVEAARFGENSAVSLKRGVWFFPRSQNGLPLDVQGMPWLPLWVQRHMIKQAAYTAFGPISLKGWSEPDHKPFEKHPTVNSELMNYIQLGSVKARVGIESYTGGKKVRFENGVEEEFDLIVFSTGYWPSVPLLSEFIDHEEESQYPKFRSNTFIDGLANVYCIGLGQARYGAGPMYMIQSEWISKAIIRQLEMNNGISHIFKSLGYGLSGTSKRGKSRGRDHVVDPYAFWKRATWYMRLLTPWMPFLERFLGKLRLLNLGENKIFNNQTQQPALVDK